nr:reverse transcriptase domain-containing protein [Tanacetum cinerariifolium]
MRNLRRIQPDSPAEEAKTEPSVWDVEPVDVNPFGGKNIGSKIEILEFTGKVHPDDFIGWSSMVEWRQQIERKSKVKTWEKMKKLMKAKFLPENHRQEAFLDYHNLSQQNMTVEEVINEFDKLRMRCDVGEEEEQVVARFLGVLKLEIADICGELGHFEHDCPNLKTLAFVPDDTCPIYDIDAEPEVDEPCDELTQAEGSNLCMKKTDFKELLKTSPYVVTFVVVEKNNIISEAPLQVQPLLRKFSDVIPNDIPPGLPVMRAIQHCIDFIPGSAIPNRPAYRMNLKEFTEL